ncbi:MAG: hypothetical protein WC964_02810 [Acholeplasmataceae bacterium]
MKLSNDSITVNQNTYYLFASNTGLYAVSGQNEDISHSEIQQNELVHDPRHMQGYTDQLKSYLLGKTKSFNFPLHITGTQFQQTV